MTPEEKFSQQVWEILQHIQEEILATEKGKPVKYRIPNIAGVGIIPKDRKIKILYKLQEGKVFDIQKNSEGVRIGTDDIFYLIIDPLKFQEVYEKYQKACDLNSYLKDYQQKLYEGTKKIPKFFQVEQEEKIVERQKNEQALRPINFTPQPNPPTNPSAKKIFKSFSPRNYKFVLTMIKGILSLTDFSTDGKINYQLQSPQGQSLINERALLSKLSTKGLFKNFGEDGIFGIATLGNLNIKVLRKLASYLSIALEQSKTKSIEKPSDIENERYNKSLADALRKMPEKQRKEDEWVERVTVKVRQNIEKNASEEITSKQKSPDLEERYKKISNEIIPLQSENNKPEEKFAQNVWWILREIKKEILLTMTGEKVEFNLRQQSKKKGNKKIYNTIQPSEDVQRKLLYKLHEWEILKVEWYEQDWKLAVDEQPNRYLLKIWNKKFNRLYKKYENSINYNNQLADVTPSLDQSHSIIKLKLLETDNSKGEKRNSNKFPYKIPAGTTWKNFTIKFLDNENVFIQVGKFKHNTNYKEVGFVGKGNNPNPSVAWEFLKVLSKLNGELTIQDKEARDKYKKQKELLAKSLQSYFSIDYDPFYPYHSSSEKSGNSYKIKIALIPPPETKERGYAINVGSDKNGDDDLGIKDFLDEQTPQAYEDK